MALIWHFQIEFKLNSSSATVLTLVTNSNIVFLIKSPTKLYATRQGDPNESIYHLLPTPSTKTKRSTLKGSSQTWLYPLGGFYESIRTSRSRYRQPELLKTTAISAISYLWQTNIAMEYPYGPYIKNEIYLQRAQFPNSIAMLVTRVIVSAADMKKTPSLFIIYLFIYSSIDSSIDIHGWPMNDYTKPPHWNDTCSASETSLQHCFACSGWTAVLESGMKPNMSTTLVGLKEKESYIYY